MKIENKKAILTMIKEDFLLAGSGGSLLIISLQTGKVIRRDILVQKGSYRCTLIKLLEIRSWKIPSSF